MRVRALTAGTVLVLTGGLIPATAVSADARPTTLRGWERLAQCESGGNWKINTGNGYYGGLQFSASTWRGFGGTKYARYAHQATKLEQIRTAQDVQARQGWRAWPVCSRKVGLR
ncbi:transglycosylase family protein [Nocardioidaceae bacterium]|nr:transglycosylase family protein [Nocardioidaceae bacterium]